MNQALKAYNIQKRTALSLEAIGTMINQQVRGWINYFDRHGRNDLWHLFYWLNYRLMKWWKRKYRTGSIYVAIEQLKAEQKTSQKLFAHWQAGYTI